MKQTVWMLVMLAAGVAGGQQIAATGDVGANVNAAFRAASGTREKPAAAALVTIPPGTYRYATTIEIPNESGRSLGAGAGPYVYAPVLDCQGAVLNFTGTGDAVFVHGEGSLGVASTGQIRNCVIRSATPHSTTVKSLIHIASRTGFTLSTLRLENAQWCVDWENTTADGGQGFNEDDNFEHIQSQGCADHIHAHVRTGDKGATGSLEYSRIDNWHFSLENAQGEERGLAMYGVGMQGSWINVTTNAGSVKGTAAAPVSLIYLSGSALFRSTVLLHGENTGGIARAFPVTGVGASEFYNEGGVFLDAFQAPQLDTGSQAVFHPAMTWVSNDVEKSTGAVHVEAENGEAMQRRCKFDVSTRREMVWLANYDPAPAVNCEFQVVARDTTNQAPDVYHAAAGSPIVNVLYASGQSKSVGIGPGYGSTVATGMRQPGATLEVSGSEGLFKAGAGQLGYETAVRTIEPDGSFVETFTGGPLSGQPSYAAKEKFYSLDAPGNPTVTGMQRFEAGGVVHYSVPADFAAGSFVAGKKPGISTDVHLGGCTLTFTSGLLTGKSGEC